MKMNVNTNVAHGIGALVLLKGSLMKEASRLDLDTVFVGLCK